MILLVGRGSDDSCMCLILAAWGTSLSRLNRDPLDIFADLRFFTSAYLENSLGSSALGWSGRDLAPSANILGLLTSRGRFRLLGSSLFKVSGTEGPLGEGVVQSRLQEWSR